MLLLGFVAQVTADDLVWKLSSASHQTDLATPLFLRLDIQNVSDHNVTR